jgi:hypothetical protein
MQKEKHVKAYLEESYFCGRPRRNWGLRNRNAVLANILAEAEAAGDAMRYLDKKGRMAWKATPKLREHLSDFQADAEADAEAEDM